MSALYEPGDEYLPNIPEYIQDIVLIHNFRNALPDTGERQLLDWYVDYLQYSDEPISYPHLTPTIVED